MSLRDAITNALTENDGESIGNILGAKGYGDLNAEIFQEALLHFSETAPLPQAEALSPIVTNYYENSHDVKDVIDRFDEAEFTLADPLPTPEVSLEASPQDDNFTDDDISFGEGALPESGASSFTAIEEIENPDESWLSEVATEEAIFEDATHQTEGIGLAELDHSEDDAFDLETDLFE